MEKKLETMAKIDVEALKSQLLIRKNMRERFKLPCTEKQAVEILTAAYQAEVEYRLRTFILDDNTVKNIGKLAKFLTADTPKFGIMLSGRCGNGKTTLIYAFQSAVNLMNEWGLFVKNDVGIQIVDSKDVSLYTHDKRLSRQLAAREMLAIEDMGREPSEIIEYGNIINPLVDLLEYRYNNQLFTIISTNLTPKEIREKYGIRIADRFNEMFEKIVFVNETYRGKHSVNNYCLNGDKEEL